LLGIRPIKDSAVKVLPLPDSPTIATVSFLSIENETSFKIFLF